MADQDRLTVSIEEAAGLLGISRALAYDLVRRGELPQLRLGRRVVIQRKALVDFNPARPLHFKISDSGGQWGRELAGNGVNGLNPRDGV